MNVLDAFYHTVHSAEGGCGALAERMGMSVGILRNKANPKAIGNIVGLLDADLAMGLTRDYRVLHALAANHGHVCIPVDTDVPASDMAVLEMIVKVMAHNGNLGAAVGEALADGRIERHEVERIRTMVFGFNRTLQEMLARLEGMAEK